ncbi:glutamate ABC transporter substrate-binding protein [Kitasatospora sp. CM 4170]|uniref:Glutamate ABC transporter substrate-binding protein n=1 Tax=Kitasatospora aburaviensis TaxID=67265 RepID=A0ABW1F727_9ACTN|nr:glutamate ABC transporter substrate-binding protein [Kitasatospora sp. CM 4170]WNM49755.1 glutamate ABC transporter substrate-binding protein [Kitasatospora sp. CM 4170]
MKLRKVTAAAAAALALTLAAAGCSSDGGGGTSSGTGSGAATGASAGPSGGKITVGIKFDQPGIGLKTPDGTYTGFDVDVATYIAKQLGYQPDDIVWKEAKSADRETLLQRGDVDFIAASYSITPAREEKVDFAGPYLLAHQDVLIRADDTSIQKPEDLNNKKLCSVTGSTSAQNVKTRIAPNAQLQEYGGYSECLTGLENKVIDALTTDDSILAGYAAQPEFKGKFKLGGFKMSDENYGIGVQEGSELKAKINTALEQMVQDGSWDAAVKKNFGPANYHNEPAPKIGVIVTQTATPSAT